MSRKVKNRPRKSSKKTGKKQNNFKQRGGQIPAPGSMGSLSLLIEQGVQLHRAGQFKEAETLYQRVLHRKSDHPDANHLLGVLAYQTGLPGKAIDLIQKAISANPNQPFFYNNLGNAQKDIGQHDRAIANYRKALAIKKDFVEVHNNLGNAFKEQGKLNRAQDCYRQAIALHPDYAEAHNNLAILAMDSGRYDDARVSYERAIAVKSDYPEAHNNLGVLFKNLGRFDDAVSCYSKALSINPRYAEAHYNMGNALKEIGRVDAAVESYQKTIVIKPNYAEAYNNLGGLLYDLGRFDESLSRYQGAIAVKPDYAEAYNNLGNVLKAKGQFDNAVGFYRKAILINPDYVEAHCNLGTLYQDMGRLGDAVNCYSDALELNPDFASAWNNFKFAVKALKFTEKKGLNCDDYQNGLSHDARKSTGFAMLGYYLRNFKPHEALELFKSTMERLPSKREEEIIVEGGGKPSDLFAQLPDKVVALLHFGRSGTGLLHSLIDGHPEISTLPSIYLRGFFNPGVWRKITAGGWDGLPERFADEFAVLFDAASPKPVPSRQGEDSSFIGWKEGMTAVGEGRDETLSLDRDKFCHEAYGLMKCFDKMDPLKFLMVIHTAFEAVLGASTKKSTAFYHIHNPDDYAKLNFLKYAPDARIVMMVREPVQSLESWVRVPFKDNDYEKIVHRIITMLFDVDQIAFRTQDSVGVRLEDLKANPKATLGALCEWLGIEENQTLFQMTAQGRKWWGDPTSPDYDKKKAMSPFGSASINRSVGSVFSEKDQFVLQTLFYPFSVKFGYSSADAIGFKKRLNAIRPLLDGMFDFEKVILERSKVEYVQFKSSGQYLLLRAGLLDRWDVLNEFNDYPYMLPRLDINA